MTLGNESWRIGHRYSEFYKMYSAVYNQLCKSFPSGMKNVFPSDRLSNWLSLTNQETINDTRRKALDAWLRELCNSPEFMLDDPTRKIIFKFFEVDENMSKARKSAPQQMDGKKEFKAPSRQIQGPSNAPTSTSTTPPRIPFVKIVSSSASASQGPGSGISKAVPVAKEAEESNSFAQRRKSALQAQSNDYDSTLSPGKQQQQQRNVPRNSEVRFIFFFACFSLFLLY